MRHSPYSFLLRTDKKDAIPTKTAQTITNINSKLISSFFMPVTPYLYNTIQAIIRNAPTPLSVSIQTFVERYFLAGNFLSKYIVLPVTKIAIIQQKTFSKVILGRKESLTAINGT